MHPGVPPHVSDRQKQLASGSMVVTHSNGDGELNVLLGPVANLHFSHTRKDAEQVRREAPVRLVPLQCS